MKEEKKIRKKIKIEDLLPRDPIRVDLDAILGYVKGKTILVTGGGGSIGSEICRQLAGHDVGHLIILTSTKQCVPDSESLDGVPRSQFDSTDWFCAG